MNEAGECAGLCYLSVIVYYGDAAASGFESGSIGIMVRDFFVWWFGQLADLLPEGLRRSALTAADALVITPIGPLGRNVDAIAVSLRRNGKETPLGRFGLGATGLAELPRAAGRTTVLRLGEADVLGKTVSLPLAAERELDQVLAFEMDRETPFNAEELYWNHRIEATDRQNGRLSVRLLLVPKANLDPLLPALAQVGIEPRRAEIADGPDKGSYLPLDGNGGRAHRSFSRLVWPAAACCAALALAAVVTPFVRQELALASLDRKIAAGRAAAAEADGLRKEADRLSGSAGFVESERDKAGRPLPVLAAATRILPDDTFLTELELRQRKVTFSGRSAGAARLIGALAADGEFRNPGFSAPVTRVEALQSELFTINAEIGP
jgi:general secretion pathway protein L